MYRFRGTPSVKALEDALAKTNQFWIISGDQPQLTDAHLAAIRRFFEAGHGVYIWGDNQPYYADANRVGSALLDVTSGATFRATRSSAFRRPGPRRRPGSCAYLLTTGLEYVYRGITIATIQPNGSDAAHLRLGGQTWSRATDRAGKRAIFDGGFTRLYNKWDTAGTARYVKNAAAWLANAERFGSSSRAPSAERARAARQCIDLAAAAGEKRSPPSSAQAAATEPGAGAPVPPLRSRSRRCSAQPTGAPASSPPLPRRAPAFPAKACASSRYGTSSTAASAGSNLLRSQRKRRHHAAELVDRPVLLRLHARARCGLGDGSSASCVLPRPFAASSTEAVMLPEARRRSAWPRPRSSAARR